MRMVHGAAGRGTSSVGFAATFPGGGRLHGLPPAFSWDTGCRPTDAVRRRIRFRSPSGPGMIQRTGILRKPSMFGGLERPENSPVDCFQRKAGGSPGPGAPGKQSGGLFSAEGGRQPRTVSAPSQGVDG